MAKGKIFRYLLDGLQDIYFQEIDGNHRLAVQLPNNDKDEEIEKRDAKIIKISCPIRGEIENITDNENW